MQLQKVNHIILKTETSVMALKTNAEGITQDLANGLKANIIAITGNKELKDGESIYEGQTIKYYITLTNETDEDLSHVKVTASQVNGKVWKMVDIEALNPGTQENQIEKHYKQTQDSDIEFDTIENIPRGESITLTYEAYANDLEDNDEITTYGTIHISGEDPSVQEELKTQEAIIKDAEWSLAITEGRRQDADLYDGDILKLNINLINKNDTPKSDVTIKIIYSSKLKYSENSIYLNTDYLDEETGEMVSRASIENVEVNDNGETIITLKISDIEANETMDISMFADIPVFYSMEEEVNVRAFIEQTESEQYVSNELTRKITGRTKNISLEEKSFMDETEIDADTIVKHGATISMEYTISNNDTRDANIEITKSLLEGLDNISVVKKVNEETIDLTDYIDSGIFAYKDVLKANTEEKIIFTGTVDLTYVLEDTLEYELSVQDTDTGSTYSKNVLFTTNKSEIADEEETDDPEATEPDIDDNEKWEIPEEGQDDDGNDDNDDDNDNDDGNDDDNDDGNEDNGNDDDQNTGNGQDDNGNQDDTNQDIKNYTISGIAWIDSDADGKRSSSETVLENVSIMAMNAATGQLMTQTTKTDSEGKYSLTLPEEKYILLFLYNETEYYVTTYQAKGIDETVNSDAISKNVTIDGVDKTVGATDEINLQSDRSNIDIGLIYRAKFDLKVEKYISKVTVSNEEGTETTEYNNTSLAKTEIASKYLKGSLVVVEYTIKITNIGEIAGYIGEIIDEAPSSLEFKSNMNSNWFLNNGKLYNMSLENKKLDVNESSEVKLILTKTMTESNTGLVNNTAYIQNSYNERGINDLDAGNDKNSANLMISVKTGVVFKFLSLTLVIIIIEFGVVFIITKKVLLK